MATAAEQAPIPVTIVTGFLGSGKTTLLNRLLKQPQLADTAVIVNEFGAVGIDHVLVGQAIENTILLKNGCICCSVRGDITDTLEQLWQQRARGEIPGFSRIAIETTGLADPGPVAHTLAEANDIFSCRLDGIVVTLDALHGATQLADQEEARRQVALADRVLLTKTDLASQAERAATIATLRRINPTVDLQTAVEGDAPAASVFGLGPDAATATRWLAAHNHAHDLPHAHHHAEDESPHAGDVQATVITRTDAIAWPALQLWLDSVLSTRGADILRLKGLVRLEGTEQPVVLQAVHHVLHRPAYLPANATPPESRLVVISRDIDPVDLRESFTAAMRA